MYSRLAKTCGLALATGLVAATLAGCVHIETTNDSGSPSASSTGTPAESAPPIEGTATPSDKNPDGTATGTGIVPKETNGDSFSEAFRIIEPQATTKKCSGKLTVDGDGQMLKLIGNCQQVEITGTGNMVIGGHVRDLSITGAGNIVAVNNIGNVEVSGVGNAVAWRNDNASARDTGQSNQLGPGALAGVDLGH
ncbi:DUF3060 domain-containing protein [Glutamicibacter sp. TV12E]|uniref:DUF3060 domain-containing protein n=1 Tax=Glutamicibacter sp. TV12E TaxID=3446362 RepID=UPI004034A5B9